MQIIQHFAVGVYGATFHTTLDASQITDNQSATAEDALIDFDNRLIASGVSATESFLDEVRQTFCILEPISAGEGFTTAEFQALVACQLSDTPAAVDTTAFTGAIANCAALNPGSQTTAVQNCYSADTEL